MRLIANGQRRVDYSWLTACPCLEISVLFPEFCHNRQYRDLSKVTFDFSGRMDLGYRAHQSMSDCPPGPSCSKGG